MNIRGKQAHRFVTRQFIEKDNFIDRLDKNILLTLIDTISASQLSTQLGIQCLDIRCFPISSKSVDLWH